MFRSVALLPFFFSGPAQSGILSDREVVNLFLHFTVNPKPRVDYIDRPRCCLRGKECSINRFQQVESRWGYSGTSDRIRYGSCFFSNMTIVTVWMERFPKYHSARNIVISRKANILIFPLTTDGSHDGPL